MPVIFAFLSQSMPHVEFRDSNGDVQHHRFTQELSVGRADGNDIQLFDDLVSKQHMKFEVRDGVVYARDVGSRNGTWLNGHKLEDEHEVGIHDVIKVGRVSLHLREKHSDKEKDATIHSAGHRKDSDARSSRDTKVPEVSEPPTQRARGGGSGTRVMMFDTDNTSQIQTRLRSEDKSRFQPADTIEDPELIRQDYEKLRIANELTRAISSEIELDRLMERTIHKALDLFNAERGAILLFDEQGELEPKVVANKSDDDGDEELRVSRTLIQEVTEERSAILSSDAMLDQRFRTAHSIVMSGIRSIMVVPLLSDGEILGVIHLDSRVSSDIFTEKDLRLLNGFAQQAANAIQYSRLIERRRKDMMARERLQRLLPSEVVEEVMQGERDLARGGELKEATVLFADIRGFTALSERINPKKVVGLLNDYFELMVEVIFEYGGALDKFIGDEIMAVWGAHVDVETHAEKATLAALEMQRRIKHFNKNRRKAGKIEVHMGIGINAGELVAGYMGSSRAMNYTVIGDVVNVAARLCSVAKPNQILVSEDVWAAAKSHIEFIREPSQSLKGKSESVTIFRALNEKSSDL